MRAGGDHGRGGPGVDGNTGGVPHASRLDGRAPPDAIPRGLRRRRIPLRLVCVHGRLSPRRLNCRTRREAEERGGERRTRRALHSVVAFLLPLTWRNSTIDWRRPSRGSPTSTRGKRASGRVPVSSCTGARHEERSGPDHRRTGETARAGVPGVRAVLRCLLLAIRLHLPLSGRVRHALPTLSRLRSILL